MEEHDGPQQLTCPGESYAISRAICRTRQRNQYPKCLLCKHRDAEVAGAVTSDPKVDADVFRKSGVLGRVPDEVNEYVLRKVGLAAAQYLRAESPSSSRLVVACDLRENSRSFTRIFCEGANRGGLDTVNVGTVPPELLAFVLGTDGCTGAAFIGGGNYGHDVNGVRVWRRDASPMGFGDGLEKVGLIARRLRTGCSRMPGQMSSANPMPDYVAYVRKFAPKLQPLTVVVDAAGGAGGQTLAAVLEGLSPRLVPLHFEPSNPNPFLGQQFPCQEVVSSVARAVREAEADLGAALDFTGERIAFLDEEGRLLGHDVAAGLIAAELLARTPGAAVAYDHRSTACLRARIEADGGTPVSAPAGPGELRRKFRSSEAIYGADLSGLHLFRDFFRFPSPAVALLVFCGCVSRRQSAVSELAGELDRFSRSGEVVIEAPSPEEAQRALDAVKEEFRDADRELIDGLTVRRSDWWFNLRQRTGEAALRLNVEGRSSRDLRRGRQRIERLVSRLLAGRG